MKTQGWGPAYEKVPAKDPVSKSCHNRYRPGAVLDFMTCRDVSKTAIEATRS